MHYVLLGNGDPIVSSNAQIPVPWWSFTKTLLCAAALTLVRDRLIALDEALPPEGFTLRQLLQHRAGLADYGDLPQYHAAVARGDAPWPVDELLKRVEASRLRYPPGTQWRYSNVGYLYVAQLIERLSGQALHEALVERVLQPLGLSGVLLVRRPQELAGVQAMAGYHPAWVYHGLLVGPLAQAAHGLERLASGALLSPSLLSAMLEPRLLGGPIAGRPWLAPGYGLGLMIGTVSGGLTLYGHTGGGPGSSVAVYRAVAAGRSATCAVFCEGDDPAPAEFEAARQLLSVLSEA